MSTDEVEDHDSTQTLRDHLARALEEFDPTLEERLGRETQAHLELISLTQAAQAESEVLLGAAVASARNAGCTWEQIGAVLGMTRQSAQQRFRQSSDTSLAPADVADSVAATRLTLRPLTAFNEMQVLDRAGRYGWHSIAYGPLFHIVQADDRQWEHARTSFGRAPWGEGWQQIGPDWGWWRYWSRRLDLPVLPGAPTAQDLVRG